MSSTLRAATIRLAHSNPALRPHLLPLLAKTAAAEIHWGDIPKGFDPEDAAEEQEMLEHKLSKGTLTDKDRAKIKKLDGVIVGEEGKTAGVQAGSVPILNSGTKLNPADPKPNDIYEESDLARIDLFVFEKDGKQILVVGGANWKVGDEKTFHGDQSRRDLGQWKCVGVRTSKGATSGALPKKALAAYAIK